MTTLSFADADNGWLMITEGVTHELSGQLLHTTDGGVLYSFDMKTGRALWRYEGAGELVHREGSPVVAATFPVGAAAFMWWCDGGGTCVAERRGGRECMK